MNDQPLDDDAELLRSLKPARPEVDWQKVLSHLPEPSVNAIGAGDDAIVQPSVMSVETPVARPRIERLVSSWWSGALAGSLITFALLRFVGTQPVSNGSQDVTVAHSGPSIENSNGANHAYNNDTQVQVRPQRDLDGWDPIVDSGVWSSRFRRHGIAEKLVSKSAAVPTDSIHTRESAHSLESAPNSSDGFPKSQAELYRELLDFN